MRILPQRLRRVPRKEAYSPGCMTSGQVAAVAGSSQPWKRLQETLVFVQDQQEGTAGIFVVVVWGWFSVAKRNTVICTLDGSPWLQQRGETVGSRWGRRGPARRLQPPRREKTGWNQDGPLAVKKEQGSESKYISEGRGLCGLYCVPQKHMSKCNPRYL